NLIFYGSQDNGTWKLELNGPLTKVLGGDGMVCKIDPKNADTVYASYYFGEIVRSDDGGISFGGERLPPRGAGGGAWVTPLCAGRRQFRHHLHVFRGPVARHRCRRRGMDQPHPRRHRHQPSMRTGGHRAIGPEDDLYRQERRLSLLAPAGSGALAAVPGRRRR